MTAPTSELKVQSGDEYSSCIHEGIEPERLVANWTFGRRRGSSHASAGREAGGLVRGNAGIAVDIQYHADDFVLNNEADAAPELSFRTTL